MYWPRFGRWGGEFDPWQDLRRLRSEMNDLFEGLHRRSASDFPGVNIWSKPDELKVTAELPGVEAEDLDVSVQGDTLTIRGKRKPVELNEGETYHRQERGHGEFVRTLQLPYAVENGEVNATFKNGVLTLLLPRAAVDKPKRISVSAT